MGKVPAFTWQMHACCGSWMWACEHGRDYTKFKRTWLSSFAQIPLLIFYTFSLWHGCTWPWRSYGEIRCKSNKTTWSIFLFLFHLLDEDWSSPPKSSGSSLAQAKINHRPRLFTREVKRKVVSNEWLSFSQPPTGFVLYGRWRRAERGLGGLPRSYSINLCPCVHMLLACSNDMDCFDCQHTFCASSTLLGVKPSGSCAFTGLCN